MRKAAFAVLGFVLLYGCASQPSQEGGKAGVESRTPTAAAVQPSGSSGQAQAVKSSQVQVNPLKDPNNILSKRSVYFDFDSDVIKDKYRPLLQAHANYLQSHPNAKVLIQGNTDDRGSREYNLALGQRRAEAMKRMMVLMGANAAQIEAVSLGEEKPRCTQDTEACWAQNRRGDILYNGEY